MYMPAPKQPGVEPKKEKGRQLGDPWHIGPRGKTASRRKGARDPGFTPTEQRTKDRLMRQFMRNPEGTSHANTEAYRNASCWCSCGARLKQFPVGKPLWCRDCADPRVVTP